MVFSSLQFVFIFMPIFFICYYLVPKRGKNLVLLLGSLSFYAVGTYKMPSHFIIFILSMLVDYSAAMLIDKKPDKKKLFLWLGILFHVITLGFYKYMNFIISEIAGLMPNAGISMPLKILLPIGISFYTFQGMSYICDVYRGDVKAEKNLLNFCVYISMFAQLIAGPIVNFSMVQNELHQRKVGRNEALSGFGVFVFGMGLKVLLANPLGKLWFNANTIGFESLSTPLAWMAIFAYSFQIYFDFFGYSLMAIGLGRMMGFNLPKNFNFPYLATSMTEFWRRWHITLGSWFREYVYIPLGGNRKGLVRTIFNMLIVWLLTGIWHGAGYNFILWGFMLFSVISLEKYVYGKYLDKYPALGHIYMLLLIPMSWAIFEVGNMDQLAALLRRLFPFISGESVWSIFRYDYQKYLKLYWPFFVAAIIFCTHFPFEFLRKIQISGYEITEKSKYIAVTCKIVLLMILAAIFGASVYCMYRGFDDPFLYFRF